jgi:hypothetical protein
MRSIRFKSATLVKRRLLNLGVFTLWVLALGVACSSGGSGSKQTTSPTSRQQSASVATPQATQTPVSLPGGEYPPCKRLALVPAASLKVTPPPPELPPALAAFSGVWEGEWNSPTSPQQSASVAGDAALIVQTVTATGATAIEYFKGQLQNEIYVLTPDGKLDGKGQIVGGRITWTMAADLKSISGLEETGNVTGRVKMTRCTPAANP